MITFTAIRLLLGFVNGRVISLLSDSHASASIIASVDLSAAYGSLARLCQGELAELRRRSRAEMKSIRKELVICAIKLKLVETDERDCEQIELPI